METSSSSADGNRVSSPELMSFLLRREDTLSFTLSYVDYGCTQPLPRCLLERESLVLVVHTHGENSSFSGDVTAII